MKPANKKDILKIIDKSTEDLHQKIDMHRYLMATILEQRVNSDRLKEVFLPSQFSKEGRLKEAIKETIEVLEQSRKAFKSKWGREDSWKACFEKIGISVSVETKALGYYRGVIDIFCRHTGEALDVIPYRR